MVCWRWLLRGRCVAVGSPRMKGHSPGGSGGGRSSCWWSWLLASVRGLAPRVILRELICTGKPHIDCDGHHAVVVCSAVEAFNPVRVWPGGVVCNDVHVFGGAHLPRSSSATTRTLSATGGPSEPSTSGLVIPWTRTAGRGDGVVVM